MDAVARLVAAAERPVFVVGGDVYFGRAEAALARAAAALRVPVFANGMGRGCLPADDPLAFARVRGLLRKEADLVVVVGTPLDFRLGFGDFGAAAVVHVVDSTAGGPPTGRWPGRPPATWPRSWTGWPAGPATGSTTSPGSAGCGTRRRRPGPRTRPSWPAGRSRSGRRRSTASCARVLDRDAVVIGDGGDFVSYAGQVPRPVPAGLLAGPGPVRLPGHRHGVRDRGPGRPPDRAGVLLLGDGAAGFSLMDVESLVRHRLPVVIVVGNNGIWGLEKHPMRAMYGYDVAADLQPETRYDEVVRALGGAGETVRSAAELGPALDRAFAAGVPYLVNVLTDPADAYPRSSVLA